MEKSITRLFVFVFLLVVLGINIRAGASPLPAGRRLANIPAAEQFGQPPDQDHVAFLPLIFATFQPPFLNEIDNQDFDNTYAISWSPSSAAVYILEESPNEQFVPATVVYQGGSTLWTVPEPGKTPDTYFYRVKASLPDGRESDWSNFRAVEIRPLFVNLLLRWDGVGYIRLDVAAHVGTHFLNNFDAVAAPNLIRNHATLWYDPDPFGWGIVSWDDYYVISTGLFHSSSTPPDPDWKWEHYRILPNQITFQSGTVTMFDDVQFAVSGPYDGYTQFGQPVSFWQLVNIEPFVFWDDGGGWNQLVKDGDAVLRYDAGKSRELLYYNVKRTLYYQGNQTMYYIRYVDDLSCSNGFIGGSCTAQQLEGPFVPGSSDFSGDLPAVLIDGDSLRHR